MRIGIDDMVAEVGVRRVLVAVAMALLASAGMGIVSSAPARAEGCFAVTEQVRLEQPDGSRLPDCRAYEQISPVDKNGIDAVGSVGVVQASALGSGVSFFAVAPFPLTVGSAFVPSYLGVRSPNKNEWFTQGIEALTPAGTTEAVIGITPDFSRTLIEVGTRETTGVLCEPRQEVCAGAPGNQNVYLRDNATGSFQFLANIGNKALGFSDATPGGSRILFETEAKLTPEAESGVNLYEWDEAKPAAERISLAGVLSGGVAPKAGAFAGPGGPAVGRTPPRENKWHFYTQNTISSDGSRVFFSDAETGRIYMHYPEAEPAVTVPISKGQAFWRAATPEGAYVLYTEGEELYRFNVNADKEEALTSGAEEGKPGVLGVLGFSDDGSYAYFVAQGLLATNQNGEGEEAEKGAENLYEWHDGKTIFIAKLPGTEEVDWRGWENAEQEAGGPSGTERSSRVTPDGRAILFSSTARLTNYSNNGLNEFYLYFAEQPLSVDNPICVSCNPQGTPAADQARLATTDEDLTINLPPRNAFLTHNLSDSGRRVFFETKEALVAGDANLQTDVYEWEADGEGSCESKAQNNGCLYLISTGQSLQKSYFGDASADGRDVFFFTRQSLVGQDQDNNADLYDARVDGGILAQNPAPAPVPCAEEVACRSGLSSSVPSVFGSPSSATFSGAGNLAPIAAVGVSTRPVTVKSKTAAQIRTEKLVKALRACRSKPKRKRKSCEASVRKRYGKAARSSGKGSR